MAEVFPSTVPAPGYGYARRAVPASLRTTLQTGWPVNRARYGTNRSEWRATWRLRGSEFQIFRTWFADDLANGVLLFTVPWSSEVLRFVGGSFNATQGHGGFHEVSAVLESLGTTNAPINTTPLVPPGRRLAVDPADSQQLTFIHRNARLASRPLDGDTTTLRVYTAESPENYIWLGVRNLGDGETLITTEDSDPPPVEPTATWPTGMPYPDSGFQIEQRAQVARLEMESEHTRQATRFDTFQEGYQVSWTFDASQLTAFQTFFFTTLESGSKAVGIPLPVDGSFNPVSVRFVGGYSESYAGPDRFRVTAELLRVTGQSVFPENTTPYALHYYPVVEVSEHTLVTSADAGKMFVVSTVEGETVNLHIGQQEIEIGVLLIGSGSVLITRTPFVHDMGSDTTSSGLVKPSFELESVIVEIETSPDAAESVLGKPTFELDSVIVQASPDDDFTESALGKPSLEIKDVLVEITPDSDTTTSELKKPVFRLEIP